MEAVEVCNQEGVLFVGVLVDVALMPHACHLTDTLITRLYSWERPYSHSQSGYIPFFPPFGLSHFRFTLSHFVLVVSPGWLTQVVLCDVIGTPDRPTGGAFDRFVRWTPVLTR